MAGAALCNANLTWAGSPTSESNRNHGTVIDVAVGQTANIAADVIDSTAVIDMAKALWRLDNGGDRPYLYVRFTSQTMAVGESLQVIVDVSADASEWVASVTQVLTGTQTVMSELTEWGRYFRLRIQNVDDTSHDYDILLSAPAR